MTPQAETLPRLSYSTLASVSSPPVVLPGYVRPARPPGVVHLGLGAFHRAHQAMVFDALLTRGDPRWGVLGVAMRSTQVADTLNAQDGFYSVQVSSAGGIKWQVVGAIWQTCVAAREPDRVCQAMAAPSTRWLTLTVTEKGYTAELAALIVRGLAARFSAGLAGLTLASCDNLSGNGDLLRALCLEAAGDTGLREWLGKKCAFPNSMVDRIVPAATPQCLDEAAAALQLHDEGALATESFWAWVMEDNFADASDADALRSVGVTVVPAVRPFEEAKLRMLNGSHTAMACMGAVLGLPNVSDCIVQKDILAYVYGLMTHEVMPNLHRPDLETYRDDLLVRFANPALRHSVHQIAKDCSQKIPQRWPPSIKAQLSKARGVEHLAFAAAAWMRYCRGVDEQGVAYALSDQLAAELQAAALRHQGHAADTVKALLAIPSIWGETLPKDPHWAGRVSFWLAYIDAQGLLLALQKLNQQTRAVT